MLKLYNSLTREKEEFKPNHAGVVNMYSCGPTVYYYPHIGNMRAYLFMDNIRRVLKYNGFELNGVMNVTDVGHLTSDADEGDDKMLVASKREQKSPWEIAKYYTDIFMKDAKRLNIDLPEHICPATSVISEIIEFVQGLLNKGYAYETSKGIYFDISKFADYGQLSRKVIENDIAGARIEVDNEKRNPQDFTVWIKAPKEHIMQWESPWGLGYPGWHIECSTIGKKFLGEYIDIHTGGVDHKPIHHENEIAQSDSLEGHKVVSTWMHVEFLQVDGGKMSKSLNNIYTLDDLEKKGFTPEAYRYFFFTTHYSKQQNFTFEAIQSAKNALQALKSSVLAHKGGSARINTESYENEFLDAINNDLNMPVALAVVWKMLKEQNSNDVYNAVMKFNAVLGLNFDEEKLEENIPDEVRKIAEKRWQAKLIKDWANADAYRNQLAELGYQVLDGKDGYTIKKV